MKKTNVIIIAVLVIAAILVMVGASLTALAEPSSTSADPTVIEHKIAHVSDIHIMIEEYCNIYSSAYQKAGNTSYKVLEQTTATATAVFDEMVKNAGGIPEYAMITGDLTSNGELGNHLGVAAVLAEITGRVRAIEGHENFQIFVIPGNHDIDNQNAKCYTPKPDDEAWNALVSEGNAAKMRTYLEEFGSRNAETTTMLEFMTIYSDFGYCNCAKKNEGIHDHEKGCKMADGVSLEFFYESDYWYVGGVQRSERPVALNELSDEAKANLTKRFGSVFDPDSTDGIKMSDRYSYTQEYAVYVEDGAGNLIPSDGLTEVAPTSQEEEAFKVDKDIEYYARASRHGACSYVARTPDGITVLGIDANSHKWTDIKKKSTNVAVVSSLGWEETTGGYMTEAQMNWMINAVKEDVAAKNLVIALAHENVLPHFDAEDEVISLFTYDNWEDVYTNMANNGIRYVLTGHQHTNDIESDVSQMGSVFYDIETGSTTCMGAGWRELDFKQTTYANGDYAEDAYSTMHYLHYNTEVDGKKAFKYQRYEINKETGAYELIDVYQGKNGIDNKDGEYEDLAEYMAQSLENMIENMAGNVVNRELMDTLGGFVDKLQGTDYYALAKKALDDLGNLNMYEFIVKEDGTFALSETPKAGYHLTDYAIALKDYFIGKDYSFDKKLGVYLNEVLLEVYGNHLIGGQYQTVDQIPEKLQCLLNVLEDGTFLRFVEDLLYRGVLPQIELILNAPIYWGNSVNYDRQFGLEVTKEMVADGKGFDLSEAATELFKRKDNFIIGAIKSLIKAQGKKPGIDLSSLMSVIRSLPKLIDSILNPTVNDDGTTQENIILTIIKEVAPASFDINNYLPYIEKALPYLNKVDGEHTLAQIVKDELLDKYVTDAFCKNLGSYGAYVVRTVMVDDSLDGVKRTSSSSLFPYEVVENFHILLTYSGDKSALVGVDSKEHTYYNRGGKDTVKVVATKDNGLLPGKITLGNVIDAQGNLDVTKKQIRWFTQRDVDYSEDELTCKQYEWNATTAAKAQQFYCEIEYADNADFNASESIIKKGENEWIEYPTIDLGIIYFNLTYAYRQYNDFDVTLEGLDAGKTYYYRLRSVDLDATNKVVRAYEWTDTYRFTTPAATGGVNVIAMTDIQGSIENNYTASLLNMREAVKGNPSYIIDCGDNVDTGKNIAQWQWLLDDQAEIWANNTFSGVAGNHEKHDYSMSMVTAVPSVATVQETGFYYSYNYQNVHFVMLNTNDTEKYTVRTPIPAEPSEEGEEEEVKYAVSSYVGLGKAQYDWLVNDLDNANKNGNIQFIVVVLHKGPYTAGSHAFDDDVIGMRKQLAPLFAEKKVDLVLQGHDHTYSVSEYIGATADENGKYLPVEVKYDATGAAIDPNGVLYVNLGTMGDKYYNYIYSNLVSLKDRSGDSYLNMTLSEYMTANGNLELSPVRDSKTVLPETPVYAYLNVTDGRLSLTTYTVINGISYIVDDIAITKKAEQPQAEKISVLGVTVKAADLEKLEIVRVPITHADGSVEVYVGYRLADLLAAAGKDMTTFKYEGTEYAVKDAYVMIAKANKAGDVPESIEPTVMICNDGSALFVAAADLGGFPGWAIALIVIAGVVVLGLIILLVLMIIKRQKKAPTPVTVSAQDASAPVEEETAAREEDSVQEEEQPSDEASDGRQE